MYTRRSNGMETNFCGDRWVTGYECNFCSRAGLYSHQSVDDTTRSVAGLGVSTSKEDFPSEDHTAATMQERERKNKKTKKEKEENSRKYDDYCSLIDEVLYRMFAKMHCAILSLDPSTISRVQCLTFRYLCEAFAQVLAEYV